MDFYSSGVSCGQCQVMIPDPFYDKLNKVLSFEERAMMRSQMASASYSRLACCIKITPELNEMICVVGNNKTSGGDWYSGTEPDSF